MVGVMNAYTSRGLAMLGRAVQFRQTTGITFNAAATSLFTQIETKQQQAETLAGNQVSGGGAFHGGVDDRERIAEGMLVIMRGMAGIARRLSKTLYPGVAAKFRVPGGTSYPTLLATATAFLGDVGPLKAVFVERGMPADFDEQLGELIASFGTATGMKNGGLAEQVGSTAGLPGTVREGVALVRDLDSILSWQFRNDPVRFAAWKSASHIERPPLREKTASGGTGGSGSATPTATLSLNSQPAGEMSIALNGGMNGGGVRIEGIA